MQTTLVRYFEPKRYCYK